MNILDLELVSDHCKKISATKYPANCLSYDHVLVGDISGLRAHFENAEDVDKQFNTDER